jgi:hypothetical protein
MVRRTQLVWVSKMNKIVRQHYPVSQLPADLRAQFAEGTSVTITIEDEAKDPLTREQLLEMFVKARENAPGTTLEEAVARVRALRDEWED